MIIWVIVLYSSCVYSFYLFLISSSSVRSIPFLSFIEPIFAWNVFCISHFLEEISSLSHAIVSLYFFALISEEGFLISPWYSLELCIHMGISFLSPLLFAKQKRRQKASHTQNFYNRIHFLPAHTVSVLNWLLLSPKSIFHCFLCDNDTSGTWKYFSFTNWLDGRTKCWRTPLGVGLSLP